MGRFHLAGNEGGAGGDDTDEDDDGIDDHGNHRESTEEDSRLPTSPNVDEDRLGCTTLATYNGNGGNDEDDDGTGGGMFSSSGPDRMFRPSFVRRVVSDSVLGRTLERNGYDRQWRGARMASRKRRRWEASSSDDEEEEEEMGAGDVGHQLGPSPDEEHELYDYYGNTVPAPYSPDRYHPHSAPPQKTRWVQKTLWLLGVIFLVRRYCPPPPLPPRSEYSGVEGYGAEPPIGTWVEYLLSASEETLSTLDRVTHIAWHVASGIGINFAEDAVDQMDKVREGYRAWLADRNRRKDRLQEMYGLKDPCRLMVPSSMNGTSPSSSAISPTEMFLRQTVVGQNHAVSVVSEALEDWDDRNRNNEGNNSRRPLVVVLAGPDGVGKSEVSHQIANLVFGHCKSEADGSGGSVWDGAIVLNGGDFADPIMVPEETAERSDKDVGKGEGTSSPLTPSSHRNARGLVQTIVDHIRRRRNAGAVIILKHVEQISVTALGILLNALDGPDSTLSYKSFDDETHNSRVCSLDRVGPGQDGECVVAAASTGRERREEAKFDNVIFVFTTDLGSDRIFRLLYKHGGSENVPKLELTTNVRDAIDLHYGEEIPFRRVITSVAPFTPLGETDLDNIMRHRIDDLNVQRAGRQWKSLVVTDPARRHLLGSSFVEYLRWQKKGSDFSLVFSKHGGHVFDGEGPMQMLRSRLRHIQQPDSVVVFDYDAEALRGIVRRCNNEEDAKAGMMSRCTKLWEGPVD